MPGRATPPMPERLSPQWAISALTSVPLGMAGAGMHHEARRLVDDDERVVLIDDIERNGFGAGLGGTGGGQAELESVARFDPVFRVHYGRRAQGDVALLDQALHAGAAQLGQALAQEAVEPLAVMARIGFRAKPLEAGAFTD